VTFLHDPQAAPNAWKLTHEGAPRLGLTLQQAQREATQELLAELTVIEKERLDARCSYSPMCATRARYGYPRNLGNVGLSPRTVLISTAPRSRSNCRDPALAKRHAIGTGMLAGYHAVFRCPTNSETAEVL
jgi:hypothetical protein